MCTVLTDLPTRFCWKLIYIYLLQWCMSESVDFFKITIGSCKFLQLASDFFANTFLCTIMNDLLPRVSEKLTYMHVLRERMCQIIKFFLNTIGSCKFMQFAIFANKLVCTVFTDLQTWFCWKLIYMYVLWWCMFKRIDFFKITIGSCNFMQLAICCK